MNAGIAQLVEHDLAKVGVASSSLVSRSSLKDIGSGGCLAEKPEEFGALTKRLCSGLQIRLVRFDSGTRLQFFPSPDGGIGRHKGFKIPRRSRCAGSSPAPGTMGKIRIKSKQ